MVVVVVVMVVVVVLAAVGDVVAVQGPPGLRSNQILRP